MTAIANVKPLALKYLEKSQINFTKNATELAIKQVKSALFASNRFDLTNSSTPSTNAPLHLFRLFIEEFQAQLTTTQKTSFLLELAFLLESQLQQHQIALSILQSLQQTSIPMPPAQQERIYELSLDTLLALNDLPKARELLQTATYLFPQNFYLTFYWAWLHLQEEKYDTAIELFQQLHQTNPTNGDLTYYLALAFEGKNDHENMLKFFKLTYELDSITLPPPQFSQKLLTSIAVKAISTRWPDLSHRFCIKIRPYPSPTILQKPPHDPRIMASLEPPRELYLLNSYKPFHLILFQQNIEKFADTTEELQELIPSIIEQHFSF